MAFKNCIECGVRFETHNDSNKCYDCCLERITQGNASEEGDFNSAAISSGRLDPGEERQLRDDLIAVEEGRSRMEPLDSEPAYAQYYVNQEGAGVTYCAECYESYPDGQVPEACVRCGNTEHWEAG